MILLFGLVGFFLVQASLMGIFSLAASPAMALVTLAVGLAYIGMAFSEASWRPRFPYAMAAVLGVEAVVILPLSGILWWSALHFLFALVSLAIGMRLNSPTVWENVLHPVHALRTRVLHR